MLNRRVLNISHGTGESCVLNQTNSVNLTSVDGLLTKLKIKKKGRGRGRGVNVSERNCLPYKKTLKTFSVTFIILPSIRRFISFNEHTLVKEVFLFSASKRQIWKFLPEWIILWRLHRKCTHITIWRLLLRQVLLRRSNQGMRGACSTHGVNKFLLIFSRKKWV
jgi:hypothetical protein